jgi:predicted CoA-binding protein
MASINDSSEIAKALKTGRTIAVVGCSPNPDRPSNSIARYLIGAGYDVIPVNPGHDTLLGRRCYRGIADIPESIAIDIVDVFRRSEFVADIALAALARNGKIGFFWMQDGVIDEDSAARLVDAGIPVAMDRCIYRDHRDIR